MANSKTTTALSCLEDALSKRRIRSKTAARKLLGESGWKLLGYGTECTVWGHASSKVVVKLSDKHYEDPNATESQNYLNSKSIPHLPHTRIYSNDRVCLETQLRCSKQATREQTERFENRYGIAWSDPIDLHPGNLMVRNRRLYLVDW